MEGPPCSRNVLVDLLSPSLQNSTDCSHLSALLAAGISSGFFQLIQQILLSKPGAGRGG